MYGDSIVGLNAYTFTNATGMKLIWNKDGNQGNQWKEGYVTVINEYPYKVCFTFFLNPKSNCTYK